MDMNFQPLYEAKNKDDFSVWELHSSEADPEPEIDLQAQFSEECEQLREQARQEGYQQGLQQAVSEIKAQQAELAKWIQLIQSPINLLDRQVSEEIMQTIFWISKACIGFELSISPEKMLAVIDDIKKELPAIVGNKQLSVHPLDKEWLDNNLKDESEIIDILVADSTLNRGDFYLHSEHCELDGRIEDRLQKILAAYLPVSKDES